MIPGATDQSAGVCELQRPVDTAAGHWARGWGAGLPQMLEPHLENSRTSCRETHKPSQLLEHCYLGNKNATCKSKSNGPLEFGNYRTESWPDPFPITADFSLQEKLPFSRTAVNFQTYPSPLRQTFRGPERHKDSMLGSRGLTTVSNFETCAFVQFPREAQHQHKTIQCWETQVIKLLPHITGRQLQLRGVE